MYDCGASDVSSCAAKHVICHRLQSLSLIIAVLLREEVEFCLDVHIFILNRFFYCRFSCKFNSSPEIVIIKNHLHYIYIVPMI